MTSTAPTVRPYASADRDQVRDVCYRTGHMGDSPGWYWRDARSFADIWTGYYTDREPESSFVAVSGERVVGFLLGCVDSARAPSPAATVTRHLLRRALLLRPGTAGFFMRSIADTIAGSSVPSGELDDPRWPSHLHINLLPEARGAGAGSALMRVWFERLETLGSPGCHLVTLAENLRAIAFFERSGFTRHGDPVLVPGMRTVDGDRMHQQTMVRSIREA